jgi:hypothetical protein
MTVTIERLGFVTPATFQEVFALLVREHQDVGYVPLAADKAAVSAYGVMQEGMVWVARLPDGTAIGTIGLTELSYWYSHETFLRDAWWFVIPEHRPTGAGLALLKAARDESERLKRILQVTVKNPARQSKNRRMMLESQDAGYVPNGFTFRMDPHV